MNNIGEKFLPIGTVVLLNGGSKRVMITGFCSVAQENQDKIYDYSGCVYPEGYLSSNQVCLFDHDQIEKIFFLVGTIDADNYKLRRFLTLGKQEILNLAITGRLQLQDPSDEPAITLLKRINPNYIPADNRHYENMPFDLPETWLWVTLSDISNYGECNNVPVSRIPEDSWILELEDIEKDSGRLIQRMNKSKRNINGVRHSFQKGDVLYSKLRTYLNKVLVADQDGYCTTEIIPITCVQGIVPEYLCHVLRSKYYVDYTISLGYGVKMPRLGTGDALKSMIPVPPYEEQRRIVKSVNEIYHKLEQRTLSAAYKFYCDKNLEDAHTAEADTRATYEVLKAQLDRYPEVLENDMKFLADYSSYNKNVDFAGRIVYNEQGVEVFNFGKYKGMSVAEILKKDSGYFGWLMQGDFTLNTKNVLTKIRLRETGLLK